MIEIEPFVEPVKAFTVLGSSVRTLTIDEFNQATAQLPELWGRFYATGIVKKLCNPEIFGVYSDYESDAEGFYTVTAGLKSNPLLAFPKSHEVTVEAGQYLVFKGKGLMPEAVVETWERIWRYFSEETPYQRAYRTDFERYQGMDEVAIYIGVC